jgi:RHS repeat-associated protein
MKNITGSSQKTIRKSNRNNHENNNRQTGIGFRLTQFVCAALIVCMLTVSAPAAPLMIKVSAGEIHQDIRFAILSGNFAAGISGWTNSPLLFFNTKNTKKQTQSIGRIEILPGDTTRRQGEPVNFSAIGYTTEGNTAGGLKFTWTVKDVGRDLKEHNLANGNFPAKTTGKFLVTAEAEGVSAQVNVVVEENKALLMMKKIKKDEARGDLTLVNKLKEKKAYSTEEISSKKEYKDKNKDKNKTDAAQSYYEPAEQSARKAHGPNAGNNEVENENIESASNASKSKSMAMMRPIDEDGWDGNNWYMADDPGNQVGNPPGTSPNAAAGNGNFQLSAPVLSLPGRGIDLNLALNYNSRLWSKTGNRMSYDSDRGFPAPGWSLGFGKMMFMGSQGGCMMVDADGTRHGYTGSTSTYNYYNYSSNNFTGHTADGTFIDYSCYVSTYNGVSSMSAWAKLANGTQIQYSTYSNNGQQAFPTQITDAQGNYLTISYRNNRGPEIQTITDTMGRVVNFNYDSLNRLISVTTPKMDNAGVRTVVQLHYKQIALSPGFSGMTVDASNWYPYVIDALYYPGTGTGYWFNDGDSYSSYGMISKVLEQRGMSWSAGGEEQGTFSPGLMSKQVVYNYDLSANYSLTDAPTYSTLTESWAGMNTPPAVTSYELYNNSNPRTITITQPNGMKSKQTSYNAPGQWYDGLLYQDETLDSANNQLGKSVVQWEQGVYDTVRPKQTEMTDEKLQTLKTVNDYGANYNQLVSQKEYDYNGTTLLKESRTSYENNSAYTGRHIFNLVKTSELFDGSGNRVARTDYEYDNNALATGTQNHNLKETPGVTMHLATADPYTSETVDGACAFGQFNYSQCSYEGEYIWVYTAGGYEDVCVYQCYQYEQISAYDPNSIFRGNVTKVTNYSEVTNTSLGGAIPQTKQYDTTGNLVAESASCCQLKTYLYDDPNTPQIDTQYAYPVVQTRGSSDSTSTVRNTERSIFDFWTGLVKESTDANGRTTANQYNPDTLRLTISTSPTGAYSQTIYDEAAMSVTDEIHETGGTLAGQSIKYLNGVGQVVKQKTLGANGVFDIVEAQYNNLGQIWRKSNPYRETDTDKWWTITNYDLLGRKKIVTSSDGSITQAFYNENTAMPDSATALSGNTIRIVDAWGRERWAQYDAQERLVEVVEPNPTGNGTVSAPGSQLTKYKYNTIGNLTETEQIESGQITQHRYFKYDSMGRMTRQKMSEQTATLNDAGQYVGAGQPGANWSEAFLHDSRSNMTQKTDARGVRVTFAYHDVNTGVEDPLNRLRAMYYDTSGPLAPGTINPSYGVLYDYETTGDQERIKKAESPGLSKEEYSYVNGRVYDYTQTVSTRENYPMTTTYLYDTLDRVKEIRYPAAYGLAGAPRKIVQQSFDVASRLSALTVDGQQQAGNVVFNARSQAISVNIGIPGTNQVNENFTFDPQSGLLTGQKVQQGGQTLLDLEYNYSRNSGSIGNLNGKTGHLSKILDNKNHAKDRSYEYDALGRLTKTQGGNDNRWTQQYTYDRFGNRESVTASGVDAFGSPIPRDGIANLSYDKNTNRITSGNANGQFEYDVAGNQTRALSQDGQTWLRYEYDSANRLSIVKKDDGTLLQGFTYSPSGGRLFNYDYISTELILYANAAGTTLSEYREYSQSTPTWTKSYTYLGESMLSTISNVNGSESIEYNHPDRLGTRVITNQQTGTNYEQTTMPFGTALNGESTITNNKKRFTSYDRSERTGLDYAINRNYDSKQGRFTQVDPIKMGAASLVAPQTLNLYSYCGNDPINHTDPDGLFFGSLFKWIGKIFKAIMIAVAVAITVIALVLMPQLAPIIGYKIFAELFLLTGTIIAQAVAPPKIGAIIGIITGMILTGPGIIVNFSENVNRIFKLQKLLTASNFVGALSNSLADGKGKKKKETREQRQTRIIAETVRNVIWRLENMPGCKELIQGGIPDATPAEAAANIQSSYDPAVLIKWIHDKKNIVMDNTISLDGRTDGLGPGAVLRFKDYVLGTAYKGGTYGMNAVNTRTMLFLHELRHATVGEHVGRFNNDWYNDNIARKCFGLKVP